MSTNCTICILLSALLEDKTSVKNTMGILASSSPSWRLQQAKLAAGITVSDNWL